jgi:hypothetical protein
MDDRLRFRTNLLLVFLVALDIGLSVVALGLPDLWFRLLHGAPRVDPQALLARTGAVWMAFTLLQALALWRWRRHPHWLVLIAGVRLTEIFSDWVYLVACANLTWPGRLGLLLSPPANLFFAWLLMRTWRRVTTPAA